MPLNRKRWSLLILSVLALMAILSLLLHRREPRYHGKPLSEWLAPLRADYTQILDSGQWGENPVSWKDGEDAVTAIGTNAIPYLLNELTFKSPFWKRHVPEFFHRWWKDDADWKEIPSHQFSGHVGLLALGTNALVALPDLERLLDDSDNSKSAQQVIRYLGEKMNPPFGRAADSEDPRDGIRTVTFYCLNHPTPAVRQAAVKLLCRGYVSTNEVIAKLTIAAKDPAPEVQREAVKRLETYQK
ncbi:MAG: domain containing protein [Verrucomicrobiales bacterium]|nr:domain containing protein [Verrucomicrobiales bacterium]